MSKVNLGKCCQMVHRNFSNYPCGNPGKIVDEGKVYCGIHNPERGRKRSEAYNIEYEEKSKLQEAKSKIRDMEAQLIFVCKSWDTTKDIVIYGSTVKAAVTELITAENEMVALQKRGKNG